MRALLHTNISGTGTTCRRTRARNTVSRKAINEDVQVVAPTKLSQASNSIQPYVLWDRVVKLTALWDARARCQAEFEGVQEELKQIARDTIAIQQVEGPDGTVMTSFTVVCNPEDRDQVAAAVLKVAAALSSGEVLRQDLTIYKVDKDHMSAADVADIVVKICYEQLADGTLQLDAHIVS
eukprot:gene4660-4913_t